MKVISYDQINKILESLKSIRKSDTKSGKIILLSGPPGAGKTKAAQKVAKKMGSDLYRVDLSAVVSKYIGETEKNLSKVFESAKAKKAILFFDEADVIIGKRTQTTDSHDRFANIDANYLLQRLEKYSGIVILSSNYKKPLDETLMQKLQFIVKFEK